MKIGEQESTFFIVFSSEIFMRYSKTNTTWFFRKWWKFLIPVYWMHKTASLHILRREVESITQHLWLSNFSYFPSFTTIPCCIMPVYCSIFSTILLKTTCMLPTTAKSSIVKSVPDSKKYTQWLDRILDYEYKYSWVWCTYSMKNTEQNWKQFCTPKNKYVWNIMQLNYLKIYAKMRVISLCIYLLNQW